MKKLLVTIPLGVWVGLAWAANDVGQGIPPAGNSGASATDGFTANRPGTARANEMNRGRDPRYLIPGQTVPPLDSSFGRQVDPTYRANTGPQMTATSTATSTGFGTATATSTSTSGGGATFVSPDGKLPPSFRR